MNSGGGSIPCIVIRASGLCLLNEPLFRVHLADKDNRVYRQSAVILGVASNVKRVPQAITIAARGKSPSTIQNILHSSASLQCPHTDQDPTYYIRMRI